MSKIVKEELAALSVLLLVIVGLTLFGKLTDQAVDAIKWVGGSAMAAIAAKMLKKKTDAV